MQQLQQQQKLQSIFDVAAQIDSLSGSNAAAFKRIFRVTSAQAQCNVGPQLAAKYKVQEDNEQHVVSVTNMYTLEQTWYNQARTTKPQTFANSTAAIDPTNNGQNCDLCAWKTLTASDPGFGRIQLPHAVTASNLFKYAEPSHGLLMFRQHDPLAFNQPALSDLLDASWLWFQQSHKLHPSATYPYLLWNCLPRAGASQYHGHAQTMLSSVPIPGVEKMQRAASSYQQQHPGCCYFADLLASHAAVGLTRQVTINSSSATSSSTTGHKISNTTSSNGDQPPPPPQQQQQEHVAWCYASLAPVKDMEVVVVGRHLCCPAFQRLLYAALRGLIDGLGAVTFNVGVLNLDLMAQPPAGAGLERLFWNDGLDGSGGSTSSSSDRSEGGDSSGAEPGSSSWGQLGLSSSSGGHYVYGSSGGSNGSSGSSDASSLWLPGPDYWPSDQPPVSARLVSRGKLSSAASDFGGLEVFGGASIGHTDPFIVVQQLDAQLASDIVCNRAAAQVLPN